MTENQTETAVTYVKGTWQDSMNKSATLLDRSTKARKQASSLLWDGAQAGIEEWLPTADTDAGGEGFYNTVLSILGTPRKGDASKIKTVALAVASNGLVLSVYPNLSKAYAEATRLTKTVKAQAAEDTAAEDAIEAIVAPKTATTQESAAALLLSKGIDGAVVAILDVLGANNEAAHRAFIRAVATEVAARVQAAKPKPAPKAPAAPKAGTVKKSTVKKTAAPKSGAAKAKPVAAKPVDKGDAITEPVAVGEVPSDVVNDGVEVSTPAPAQNVAKKRAMPVRR